MLAEMTAAHVPVLADEVLAALDPHAGDTIVDCTFGAGGHARLIAERLGTTGTYIAIDRDPLAHEHFRAFETEVACHTRFVRASFADGVEQLRAEGVQADGLLMDL